MFVKEKVEAFIERWSASSAHERRHKDLFFTEFCDVLGVDRPDPKDKSGDYCFEKAVTVDTSDGRVSTIFIDFYRRGCFVCEAKQGSESGDQTIGTARRGTETWKKAMHGAFGQAKIYASLLPEGRPPFLITCDIGNCFEVWPGFSGDYGGYSAPSRRTIDLAQLGDPAIHEFFFKVFTDPLDLDPARHAQKVTREVAAKLSELARDLEKSGHDPELTAQFLMRCLFTMFAEDVGLLPGNLFAKAVEERWIPDPRRFPHEVEQLWRAMNDGLPFGYEAKLLRFNGGLFSHCHSIPMTAEQLQLLLDAAKCDWSNVEPTIFGTLLERALDPFDRQKLGAHFTPREYIQRLVRPAVIEPIRAEWEIVQAQVRQIMDKGDVEPTEADRKKAATVIREYHGKLVQTRVLDPACGSGNFLYVCLDLFKQIEAEVVNELAELGMTQSAFEMEGVMVNPGQFLGIELNPRAREIADLVLWLGYLQWYRRTHGDMRPSEPVLREYKNIVCRDAVLAYDDRKPRLGPDGKPLTVWNMRDTKTDSVTGRQVPDETKRDVVWDFIHTRPADWPDADFVVSNPPFVGNKMMRMALGDGYAEALRQAYPQVTATADLVMYWWEKAATLVREGKLKRFGFITTNSITQVFNRKVVESHLTAKENPLTLVWAIADHPWVDAGADVRIAMTVCEKAKYKGMDWEYTHGLGWDARQALDGFVTTGVIGRVTFEEKEQSKEPQARRVEIAYQPVARIHADLSGGADVAGAVPLKANEGMSYQGMNLVGKGFRITLDEVRSLGFDPKRLPPVIRPYLNARELAQRPEDRFVIDLYGLTAEDARDQYPTLYQWLLDRVKPERDENKRASYRDRWWIFGEPRGKLRWAWQGLARYIVTPETARQRFFVFAPMDLLPDHKLYAVCTDDAFHLGIISSRFAVTYILAAGGRMGIGNDPIFNNTRCFATFPFPDPPDNLKSRIRDLGERLDAHRKRVQAAQSDVTLTGMYNAVERLREIAREGGPALTEKERAFHDRALIGVLKQLHDELDIAVAAAYGWPQDLPDDEVLTRLVALNRERAEEENRGLVRWLRPDFQNPTGKTTAVQSQLNGLSIPEKADTPTGPQPWPKATSDQLKAIRDLLVSRPASLSIDEIAAAFKGARKSTVEIHLKTLEVLGVLISDKNRDELKWRLLAHVKGV